jgi:hypothetical protein
VLKDKHTGVLTLKCTFNDQSDTSIE